MFVQLWMTRKLVVVEKNTTIEEAGALLKEHKIRRLPVIDNEDDEKLVGILSREDVNNVMPSIVDPAKGETVKGLAANTRVATVMTPDPITVSAMDPLEKAARIMRMDKIGGIPVVEGDKLVGIVTESDIFRAFIEIMRPEEEGVRIEVIIDDDTESFYEVFEIFAEKDISVLAVTLYKNYSEKRQLLTVKVQGDEVKAAIDSLWDIGCKINSIEPKEIE